MVYTGLVCLGGFIFFFFKENSRDHVKREVA